MDDDALNEAMLAAHEADDFVALVGLYTLAADAQEAKGDTDATCYFLTQAYVFALEIGSPRIDDLNKRLCAHGREVRYFGNANPA